MVQLQPEEHDNVSSGDQRKTCLKRFLHVADFAGAHDVVAAQGKSNGGTEHGRKLRERSAQKEDEPCDHSMMGGSNDGVSHDSTTKQPQTTVPRLDMMQQQV